MTKAKYQVWVNNHKQYSCVTTTRNTEDMVNILKGRFEVPNLKDFKIIKKVEGNTNVVYGSQFIRKGGRKVMDTTSGEIWDSAKVLASFLGKPYPTIRLWVTGKRKAIKNYKYLDEVTL